MSEKVQKLFRVAGEEFERAWCAATTKYRGQMKGRAIARRRTITATRVRTGPRLVRRFEAVKSYRAKKIVVDVFTKQGYPLGGRATMDDGTEFPVINRSGLWREIVDVNFKLNVEYEDAPA